MEPAQILASVLFNAEKHHDSVTIELSGGANEGNIGKAIAFFRETLTTGSGYVVFDLASTRVIDARFLVLLIMVRKHLKGRGANLRFVGVSPAMQRLFWFNEVYFLLYNPNDKT